MFYYENLLVTLKYGSSLYESGKSKSHIVLYDVNSWVGTFIHENLKYCLFINTRLYYFLITLSFVSVYLSFYKLSSPHSFQFLVVRALSSSICQRCRRAFEIWKKKSYPFFVFSIHSPMLKNGTDEPPRFSIRWVLP